MIEVLDILLPLPVPPLRYLSPFDAPRGSVGARVAVPWQGRVRVGVVVGRGEVNPERAADYREALGWLDESSFLQCGACELLLEWADFTATPAGSVLAALVTTGLKVPLEHRVRAVTDVALEGLGDQDWRPAEVFAPEHLAFWRRQGLLQERVQIRPPTRRALIALRLPDEHLSGLRRVKQRKALAHLVERGPVTSAALLARAAQVPEGTVRSLVKKGYAGYASVPEIPAPLLDLPDVELPDGVAGPRLSDSGSSFISGGRRLERIAYLLPTIRWDLERGAGVLILVPERNHLSATAGALARACLPVLALSGECSDAQRDRIWAEVTLGDPKVLVTTYLGLLAPVRNLGRVIVLDVGSASYKLDSGPRMFAPHIARALADRLGVPIAFADVLESPEWIHDVPTNGRHRIGLPRQRLHVASVAGSANWPLGADLIRVLKQVHERDRQALLIVPRRGFSAALGCSDCGHLLMCPNCDLSLRYHQIEAQLRCHQCGHAEPLPGHCPECNNHDLVAVRGPGTQWVVEELSKLLVGFPVARFDRDHRDPLGGFYCGQPGVVAGTTALLRLPPLPKLSLIGVTLLEPFLTQGDFRAEEAALRFLLSLSNLSTSGVPLTVIQVFDPDHEVLTVAGDPSEAALRRFAARILQRRRRFGYPPFGHLAQVQVRGRDRVVALQATRSIADGLRILGGGGSVLGPAPAPVFRLQRQYVYHLLIRAETRFQLGKLVRSVREFTGKGVRVRVDVDPQDIAEFLE